MILSQMMPVLRDLILTLSIHAIFILTFHYSLTVQVSTSFEAGDINTFTTFSCVPTEVPLSIALFLLFLKSLLLSAPRFVFFELLVFFKFFFLLNDQIIFQGRQVRAYFHLNLLLGHVFKFFVLLIKWKPFRVVHIPEFVVLSPVVLLLALLSFSIICFDILLKCLVFSQACIEPILDVIVDPSRHVLLDLDPLVAVKLVELHQLEVFSNSPFVFVQVRVHVVVPPFSALLANSAGQVGCNFLPFLEAIFSHFVFENHVFFWGPVAFDLLHGTVFGIVSE